MVFIIRMVHAVSFHEAVFASMIGDDNIPVVAAKVNGLKNGFKRNVQKGGDLLGALALYGPFFFIFLVNRITKGDFGANSRSPDKWLAIKGAGPSFQVL